MCMLPSTIGGNNATKNHASVYGIGDIVTSNVCSIIQRSVFVCIFRIQTHLGNLFRVLYFIRLILEIYLESYII